MIAELDRHPDECRRTAAAEPLPDPAVIAELVPDPTVIAELEPTAAAEPEPESKPTRPRRKPKTTGPA